MTPEQIAAMRERVSNAWDSDDLREACAAASLLLDDNEALRGVLAQVTHHVEPLLLARHKQAHNGDIFRGGPPETCPLCEPARAALEAAKAVMGGER